MRQTGTGGVRDDQQRRKLFQILSDYIVTHRSRLVNRIFFMIGELTRTLL